MTRGRGGFQTRPYEISGVFSLKTQVFLWILVAFEVEIVVPESHLICDVCFWAENEVPPPTWHVGTPTSSTIGIIRLFWVYSLLRKRI
jgi:hypothetical protein